MWALGWAALTIGDGLADDAFEEARRISQATGADRELAYALMGLGAAHLRRAELTTSLELFTSALRAVGQGDDVTGRAMILYFIATTLSIDGRPSEALGFAREGLDLSEPGGDTMLHSLLGTLVGIVAWQLGDNAAAEAKLAEAARIRDRLDWVWGLVVSLDGLAWVAASSGRSERSARLRGCGGVVVAADRNPARSLFAGPPHELCGVRPG